VKNKGQNHKIKKMRATSQLHLKAGVRTPKNLFFINISLLLNEMLAENFF